MKVTRSQKWQKSLPCHSTRDWLQKVEVSSPHWRQFASFCPSKQTSYLLQIIAWKYVITTSEHRKCEYSKRESSSQICSWTKHTHMMKLILWFSAILFCHFCLCWTGLYFKLVGSTCSIFSGTNHSSERGKKCLQHHLLVNNQGSVRNIKMWHSRGFQEMYTGMSSFPKLLGSS